MGELNVMTNEKEKKKALKWKRIDELKIKQQQKKESIDVVQ